MTAAELIDAAALPEDAGALARPDMHGNAFIDALSRSGRQPDSIRALAHALPPRDAIAWAADCLRRTASADKPAEIAALEAIERWLADESDDNRRAALTAADNASATPAGVLAFAVYLSGGSVAPAQAPVVPPVKYAAAKAAAGAIVLAVVLREPEKAPEKFCALIEDGFRRAQELKIW
jgi:hypothetical protein